MIRGGPCESCFGAALGVLRTLTTTTMMATTTRNATTNTITDIPSTTATSTNRISTTDTGTNPNTNTTTITTSSPSLSHLFPSAHPKSNTNGTSSKIPFPQATPDLELDIDFVGYVGQWDLEQNLARLDWEKFRECLGGFRCLGSETQDRGEIRRRYERHNNFGVWVRVQFQG